MLTDFDFGDSDSWSVAIAAEPYVYVLNDKTGESFTSYIRQENAVHSTKVFTLFIPINIRIVIRYEGLVVERLFKPLFEALESSEVDNPVVLVKTLCLKVKPNTKSISMHLVAMGVCSPLTKTTAKTYVVIVGLAGTIYDAHT
jgi:hypothetical protein